MTLNSKVRYWRVWSAWYYRIGSPVYAHARKLYFAASYQLWLGEMAQAVIG